MLATIREKVQGWIAGIVLGLIAIPFALWGINYYFEGGQLKVAEVNGTDVSVDQYRRALDTQKRALQRMLGGKVDVKAFDSQEFRARVLDGVVDQILIASAIDSAGYRLSDADLGNEIRSAPTLQRDGKFDPQMYEMFVRSQGMDARSFEMSLRRDFLARQAESGYRESAFVTSSDVQMLLRLEGQQREAVVAQLPLSKVKDRVKVTAEQVQAYYQANSDRFRTPERVRIAYIRLSADELAKSIRLSPDEIRQAEQDAIRGVAADEQRRASHILINLSSSADDAAQKAAMAKIKEIGAKIRAGGNFGALAKQYSDDKGSAAKNGDLGIVGRGAFAPEFEKALFDLKKVGDVTAPVRTPYGLHLIKLTGIQGPNKPAPNRAKLEAELRKRKAEDRFVEQSERLHNLVYEQADTLKPASETLGLKIETTGWFTKEGPPQGILAERKVIDAAFDPEVLEQGRNSPAIEVGKNTLVALRVVEREAPRVKPLAEVRPQIEKQLLAQAQGSEAEKLAASAEQDLAGGKSLSEVAKKYGFDLQPKRAYGRRQAGTDGQLLAALFRAPSPADGKTSVGRASLTGGGQAVFVVYRVIESSVPATESAEGNAIRRVLEARRGSEYFEDYRAGLRMDAKVKRYKDQL